MKEDRYEGADDTCPFWEQPLDPDGWKGDCHKENTGCHTRTGEDYLDCPVYKKLFEE